MSAPIFISYASKDQNVAQTVCEALENRGLHCWISGRDIGPGENFQVSIVRAIRAAKVMILVFSANSNNSEEIKKELVLAGQSRLAVIPVRVEDVAPEEAFAYEFATRQWIDVFEDWESSVQRVVRQLSMVGVIPFVGPGAPASEPNVTAPTPPVETPEPITVPPPTQATVTSASPPEVMVADALQRGKAAQDRKDYAEAARWYRKAADQGNADAQSDIGVLYQNGWGVARDYAEAMRWYRKAADQGTAFAQNKIGFQYQMGQGVAQDYSEAIRWYRKAADQGDAVAQNNIGCLYTNGQGVPKDYGEAMSWLRKAADQGNIFAQAISDVCTRRPGSRTGLWRGDALVPQGRRPGKRSRAEQYWVSVHQRLGSGEGLRRGDELVLQGRRPGKRFRSREYRTSLREGVGCRPGLCRSDAVVPQGSGPGKRPSATQYRVHVRERLWRGARFRPGARVDAEVSGRR